MSFQHFRHINMTRDFLARQQNNWPKLEVSLWKKGLGHANTIPLIGPKTFNLLAHSLFEISQGKWHSVAHPNIKGQRCSRQTKR